MQTVQFKINWTVQFKINWIVFARTNYFQIGQHVVLLHILIIQLHQNPIVPTHLFIINLCKLSNLK